MRTLVFQVAAVLLLPLIWELDGIWLSVVVAEFAAAAVNVAFLVGMRKRYYTNPSEDAIIMQYGGTTC